MMSQSRKKRNAMRAFVCIIIGIVALPLLAFIANMQYTTWKNDKAADMYFEMVQQQADGANQMAVIAYAKKQCGIVLPIAMQQALARYQYKFAAKFEEASADLMKLDSDWLHAERCRMSRELADHVRQLGFS
jgi:hypothetical protein